MPLRHATVQNAYYVEDLDAAIERWHRTWGLGPFFVRRHIALHGVTYRGQPADLDISAAYVQAGDIQVELVTQHDARPSAFRDAFPPGREGFHHVAVIPDDYAGTLAHYQSLGFPVVTELRTASGRGAAYVDTRALFGHMVEVYWPSEGLTRLYRDVAEAARGWDGRQLIVEVDARG
jgi:hypothetical protein